MVITPSAGAMNLEELTQLADRIVEASPTPTIAANNTTAQLFEQVSELNWHREELSMQMSKTVGLFRYSRSRSPGPWTITHTCF